MPINDLPKSLVDSVIEVVTKSEKNHNIKIQRIVSEGLAHFGVSCVSELSEGEQKALHAWTQIRLAEEGCSCGSQEVEEDDMPGDAPFHKDGDEDGEKKKDIDEEDSEDELKESVALAADEIATNGAVGVADATQALPKHADVIQDTDPYTGTTQYRLLIQYATNEGTQIYPPVSLPGAVSVADLRTLVQGLPEFNEAIDQALVHASPTPVKESVISEARSVTAVVVGDVFSKSGSLDVKIKDGTKLTVSSAKDLATALNIPLEDLFLSRPDEQVFNDALTKGTYVYCYMDPYNYEISNVRTVGFEKTEKEALKKYQDSADDI